MRSTIRAALGFALSLIVLSACATTRSLMETTQPETQAVALVRVEELIRNTARALTPRPRLEPMSAPNRPDPCLESHDGGTGGRVIVSRAYWLRDLAKSENMAIARQVMEHWEKQGHVITSTGGFQVGHPSVGAMSRPDGFILALVWAEGDHLYLAATSPCVWPAGTPAP